VLEVKWSKPASTDFLAVISYVADKNPDAAQRLKDEIQLRIAQLPDHPRLYKPGRVDGTREIVVMPNYLIIYRETSDTLIILRVLHAARQWPTGSVG
jgi:addiction module RelE/StbE family toxin